MKIFRERSSLDCYVGQTKHQPRAIHYDRKRMMTPSQGEIQRCNVYELHFFKKLDLISHPRIVGIMRFWLEKR